MEKIEHFGIAVKDIEKSNKLFAALFGKPHYKTEEVKSEGVKTSFFDVGPNKIELLEATYPERPLSLRHRASKQQAREFYRQIADPA